MLKTWILSCLPTQEEFGNICFVTVGQRIPELLPCLCHAKMIIHNQFFFTDLISILVKKSDAGKNILINGFPYSHGKHDGAICNSVNHCICKLKLFTSICNLLSLCLLYKSISVVAAL